MTKLEQAARQALGALVRAEAMYGQPNADIQTALREALDHSSEATDMAVDWDMVKPEAIASDPLYQQGFVDGVEEGRNQVAEQAEQEPVIGAYEVVNEKGDEWSLVYPAAVHRYKSIPEERITQTFYAAPVRTKDLTDDEIGSIYEKHHALGGCWTDGFAYERAVIAADREKNTPPVVQQGEPVAWMFCLDGCNQVVLDEDSDSVIRHNGTPLVPAPVQPVKQEEAKLPVVRWLWADKYGNITNRMYTESEAKEQIASAIKLEWSRTEFPE